MQACIPAHLCWSFQNYAHWSQTCPIGLSEPRSLGLFGFPSRTRGFPFKKFSPQAHPENVKVKSQPSPLTQAWLRNCSLIPVRVRG